MWEPVVGKYTPKYDVVTVNDSEKLNKINKIKDDKAKQKIEEIKKSSTTICKRHFKKELDKSPFVVYKERE